jgi:glucokinase
MKEDSMDAGAMTAKLVGAIDIGGTKIAATVASATGLLSRKVAPTPKTGTPDTLPEQAVRLLHDACKEGNVDISAISRVGVSSCGPFVRENGMIGLAAPNICGARAAGLPNDWDVVPLEKVLRNHFSDLVIENDCVAALVAERTFGAVIGEPDCAYVTWSTGIGFGLCVDGHILHGKNGNAGHAGHMLLSENSEALCGCGNYGDVEALVAGRNLGERLQVSTADLFGAAKAGDPAARAHALEAAKWFGRALYNVSTTLDMRCFVLGGSVWLHHGDWLAPLVQHEIDSRFPALTSGVRVLTAGLGDLVADLGALCLVLPQDWIPGWTSTRPWQKDNAGSHAGA